MLSPSQALLVPLLAYVEQKLPPRMLGSCGNEVCLVLDLFDPTLAVICTHVAEYRAEKKRHCILWRFHRASLAIQQCMPYGKLQFSNS